MDLSGFLSASRVCFFPAGMRKREALEQLAAFTAQHPHVQDAADFVHAILEREEVTSTGIGEGIAVPHAKIASVAGFVISLGLCPTGIPFEAKDGKDVTVMVMIAASDREREGYLRVLATVAGLLRRPAVLAALRQASTAEAVIRALLEPPTQTLP